MTVSQAITQTAALTGQVVANAALVRWLSELDGKLALTLYRAEDWTPYDPTADLSTALLVPHPWDGLYIHHLAAMTYFTNGEYDRYENERVMSEHTLAEFRAYMQRCHARKCAPGFPLPDREGGLTPMITADKTKDQATFYGLSTDEKPVGGAVANGSAFLEMDSGKLYFYNAAGNAWVEWGAGT